MTSNRAHRRHIYCTAEIAPSYTGVTKSLSVADLRYAGMDEDSQTRRAVPRELGLFVKNARQGR